MVLKRLEQRFSVCKLDSLSEVDLGQELFFLSKTDEELSLVCPTENVPQRAAAREDGWRGFRAEGVLDFSLVGVLARLTGILAENGIGLFAVSTFNTDYILVRETQFERALRLLSEAGDTII